MAEVNGFKFSAVMTTVRAF